MKRGRKSNAIRAIIAEQPTATVKEIQAALAAKRIKASVSMISKLKATKREGGRKPSTNGHVTMDGLLAAKQFVGKLGTIEAARQSLDALARLVD
jgi:uncharacterized protein YdaL